MRNISKAVLRSGLLILAVFSNPWAQTVPSTMSYQGRLSDNTQAQNPITGVVAMEFRIFGSATGSDQLWSEVWPSVSVDQGLFNVMLGAGGVPIPPAVFSGGTDRFLEIVVNGGVLSPRQRIGSVGYAGRAETCADSERLAGHDAASFARTDTSQTFASVVTLSNPLNNITGIFAGSGAGLTGVNAARVGGLAPSQILGAYNRMTAPGACAIVGSAVRCGQVVCVGDVSVPANPLPCTSLPPACQPSCIDASGPATFMTMPARTFSRLGDYSLRTIDPLLYCHHGAVVSATFNVNLGSLSTGRSYDAVSLPIQPSPGTGYVPVPQRALTGGREPVSPGTVETTYVQASFQAGGAADAQCFLVSPVIDERLIGLGGDF